MRRRKQPARLEIGQHVANRSGGEIDLPAARQRFRSYRRAAVEITFDDETEYLAGAFCQIVQRRGIHAPYLTTPLAASRGLRHRHSRDSTAMENPMRPSGRAPDEMRAITIETGYTKHAEGSCLISFGETRVLCTASVEERIPPWLRGKGEGWVTGEYSMLPRATHTRGQREAAKGKQSGRTQEIQRLIGRSLRAVVDHKKLGERQITLDCDVIQADGGTRTASISGAWVALRLAVDGLMKSGDITQDPITAKVAAVSCGVYQGTPVLDLDYPEDSNADADANFVLIEGGKIAEAQATAEGAPYDEEAFLRLLRLAQMGCAQIFKAQDEATRK
jgi:ribonuclease PH